MKLLMRTHYAFHRSHASAIVHSVRLGTKASVLRKFNLADSLLLSALKFRSVISIKALQISFKSFESTRDHQSAWFFNPYGSESTKKGFSQIWFALSPSSDRKSISSQWVYFFANKMSSRKQSNVQFSHWFRVLFKKPQLVSLFFFSNCALHSMYEWKCQAKLFVYFSSSTERQGSFELVYKVNRARTHSLIQLNRIESQNPKNRQTRTAQCVPFALFNYRHTHRIERSCDLFIFNRASIKSLLGYYYFDRINLSPAQHSERLAKKKQKLNEIIKAEHLKRKMIRKREKPSGASVLFTCWKNFLPQLHINYGEKFQSKQMRRLKWVPRRGKVFLFFLFTVQLWVALLRNFWSSLQSESTRFETAVHHSVHGIWSGSWWKVVRLSVEANKLKGQSAVNV